MLSHVLNRRVGRMPIFEDDEDWQRALSAELHGRSVDAIKVVRQGLHEFHQEGDSSMLSKLMVQVLTEPGFRWRGPCCSWGGRS